MKYFAIVRTEIYHKSVHGTLIFFLQNDPGFEKWGPTAERLLELLNAFRPSSQRTSQQKNTQSTVMEEDKLDV